LFISSVGIKASIAAKSPFQSAFIIIDSSSPGFPLKYVTAARFKK
jgi:hypothetical protein